MNKKLLIHLKENNKLILTFETTMGKLVITSWGIDAVGFFHDDPEKKETNMLFPWGSVVDIEKPIS